MVRLAEQIFPHIDVTIASRVVEEGRALVLLVNKLDLIEKSLHNDIIEGLEMVVKYVLPTAKGVPIIPISARDVFYYNFGIFILATKFARYPSCRNTSI